jgi:nicotinamidase-related amidase
MSKALLIVDMQACHFPADDMPYRTEEVLGVNEALIARARERGTPVIYVQHCAGKGSDYEPGTPGWKVHDRLTPQEHDVRVLKCHPDSFQGTDLQEVLGRLGTERLVVAGMQTEMCVDTTVRRAYSLGYPVELVADGHTTWSSEALPAERIIAHHNHVLGRRFAQVVGSDKIEF